MTKRRNKLKMVGLLLTVALLISSLGIFSLTASAAAASDLTVTIDTGASVTLQDADGDGYYDIDTADELYAFAAAVNGGNGTINGELTADIVINENVLDENGELNGDGSNFRVWTPIGVATNYFGSTDADYEAQTVFHGQFNGGNHTISGLYFNNEEQLYVGLFGATYGATINGVGVLDCYISGYQFVGGVVGVLGKGTLENCYNAGSVLGASSVGGVAGWAGKISTVQNCFNAGNVSGRSDSIGGVVGYIFDGSDTATLKNCYSTGKIVGVSDVRGVVGAIGANTAENCFFLENTVTITGTVGNGSSVHAGTQAMSFAQFVSGEVAYKLGSAFGQTLAGENRQNYPVLGGTPVTDSERFEIYGQQLNLGGDLSMKYYVAAYAPDFDPAKMMVKFIHNGVVTTPTYEIVDGFYVFTLNGINPQCMGDSIDTYVYYDGVQKTEKLGYTVEKNLTNLLEKYPDDAALVALINDILAYGEASEGYTKYESMTGDYTVREVSRIEAGLTKNKDESENVELVGVTVRFGTMNYLVFEFEGTGLSVESIFTIGGNPPAKKYMNSEGNLVLVSDSISPDKFYDNVSLEYLDENLEALITVEYSINAYCDAIITGSGFSEEMTSLAKALYNYGVSAEIYKHAKTGEGEHTFDSAVNNGDAHTKACACGESITEGHSYEGNGECICGAKAAIISTLEELEAAIENGGEYMLGDNIQVPEYLAINTEFILHLNEKNITGDGEIFWVNTGTLTILGNGVLSTNSDDLLVTVSDYGASASIAGGTFEGEINVAMGTCEISGGQIELVEADTAVGITCTISGGKIKMINFGANRHTITGGSFGVDPTAHVDTANYTVTNNGDGTWTVTTK